MQAHCLQGREVFFFSLAVGAAIKKPLTTALLTASTEAFLDGAIFPAVNKTITLHFRAVNFDHSLKNEEMKVCAFLLLGLPSYPSSHVRDVRVGTSTPGTRNSTLAVCVSLGRTNHSLGTSLSLCNGLVLVMFSSLLLPWQKSLQRCGSSSDVHLHLQASTGHLLLLLTKFWGRGYCSLSGFFIMHVLLPSIIIPSH